MSYIPIENLNMKIAQISIASQTYNPSINAKLLFENVICDEQNVVTLSADKRSFTLNTGKSYFMSVALNGSVVSTTENQQVIIDFYNETTAGYLSQSASRLIKAHGQYRGHCSFNVECMLLNTSVNNTISLRSVTGNWATSSTYTPYYNEGNSKPNSILTILYKDNEYITIPTASLATLATTSQLSAASLNRYHQYTLANSGYRYFPPTSPTIGNIIGFIHTSGSGNFAIEYPANSGTYLTGGFINSSSVRKSFVFQWDGTTWVDIGQFIVV